MDPLLALSRFLIEQQASLFAHTHPSDPNIKHLYHLAMMEHVSASKFESNYASNLHTICSTNIKLFEQRKAKLVANIPDIRRAIRDLNRGIIYNEKLKRKYSSLEQESSQSSQSSLDMSENLSLDHPLSNIQITPEEMEKEKALVKQYLCQPYYIKRTRHGPVQMVFNRRKSLRQLWLACSQKETKTKPFNFIFSWPMTLILMSCDITCWKHCN